MEIKIWPWIQSPAQNTHTHTHTHTEREREREREREKMVSTGYGGIEIMELKTWPNK
jgi:hypothetical protein